MAKKKHNVGNTGIADYINAFDLGASSGSIYAIAATGSGSASVPFKYAEDKIMVNKVDKYINNNKNLNIAVVCFDEHAKYYRNKNIKIIKMGSIKDPLLISKNIFSILRYIDKLELDVCLIEGINKDHIGTAIENRLIRACEYNIL